MNNNIEIRASRSMVGTMMLVYVIGLFTLPVIGWLGFGPGALGDTSTNGNQVIVFWIMRLLLASFTIMIAVRIWHLWEMWRKKSILLILHTSGITDRSGRFHPWNKLIRSWTHRGTLYFQTLNNSSKDLIKVEPFEVGFTNYDRVLLHVNQNAPTHLTPNMGQ